MFINDVGQNTWEEINDGIAGANYGWPDTEGPTTDPRFRSPRYAYNHSDGDRCAITGGAFYAPLTPQFPADYVERLLLRRLLRRLDPEARLRPGQRRRFATGISSPVDLKVQTTGVCTTWRVERDGVYRVGSARPAPTITTHPANRTVQPGAPVTFSVGASGTPPLRYQWQRNGADIAGRPPGHTIAVGRPGRQRRAVPGDCHQRFRQRAEQ